MPDHAKSRTRSWVSERAREKDKKLGEKLRRVRVIECITDSKVPRRTASASTSRMRPR